MSEPTQLPGAATRALDLVKEVDKRLSTHEAICAERYTNLLDRMSRMEKIMLAVAGAIIIGLVKLAFFK